MGKSPFSPFRQAPPPIPQVAIDRLGKIIEQGHLVLYHSPDDMIYEVVDLRPVLNPSMPNAMQVTLQTQFNVLIQAAVPSRAFIIVGESAARQQARAAGNGALGTVAPDPPSALVLTDANTGAKQEVESVSPSQFADSIEEPAKAEITQGACGNCGDVGPMGLACQDCGTGTYQQPTLGDA